ncbi:MAG: hypothetical protein ACYT04_000000101305, partial [Nostoc sp.]
LLTSAENSFQTSFLASGWKCYSLRLCRHSGRLRLKIGIPSLRLGTRQSLKAGYRLAFTLS